MTQNQAAGSKRRDFSGFYSAIIRCPVFSSGLVGTQLCSAMVIFNFTISKMARQFSPDSCQYDGRQQTSRSHGK